MATTVPHRLPTSQDQAIADLTGYEDAATLRWQQACVQVANTLTALPNGRYVTTHLVMSRTFLEKNPDLVKKLLAAHDIRASGRFLVDHRGRIRHAEAVM